MRGDGVNAKLYARAMSVECPRCGAPRGDKCNVAGTMWRTDVASRPHQARLDETNRREAEKGEG